MSSERRNLSKREWWLVILVVVIGEYIFLDKVFKYGANEGIVSYVSFAGTIVSIILAVLAIVYSYYQNFSQQRDSNNIATQIELLRATVKDVRVSKEEFVDELNRINSISERLDQSISLLTESQTHVIKLTSSFESFRESFDNSNLKVLEPDSKENLSPAQMNYFFHRLPDGGYIVLYALYKSKKIKAKVSDRFDKYYKEPMLAHWKDRNDDITTELLYASWSSVVVILQAFGLVVSVKEELTFDKEIERLILTEIETGIVLKNPEMKSLAEKLRELE